MATLICCSVSLSALAWTPNRPIEVVIGFAPGSGNELVFRALANQVTANTGARFTITNRAGAGGVIANKYIMAQPNDGYHVNMAIGEGIPVQDKINVPTGRGYDIDDFTYILAPALNQYSIVAHASDAVNTPQELLEVIKSQPTTIGASGGARLVFEVMRTRIDFSKVTRVTHNGPVPAINDVMGQHIRFAIVPSLVASQFTSGGKLKIVALTGKERLPELSSVQNLDSVLPGFNVITTWGLVGPKGMPAETVDWYVREFTKALRSSEVQEFWRKNLLQVPPAELLTSAGFNTYVQKTEKDYASVVTTVVRETMQK